MRSLNVLVLALAASIAAAVFPGQNVPFGVPDNSLIPGKKWPRDTKLENNNSWSAGHQPSRLEGWPQIGFGTDHRVLLPCWKKVVLHDHDNGWPGLCMNLHQAANFTTAESCRSLCMNDPRCPVWQFINQTFPGQCWVGFGTDCAYRQGELEVNGSKVSIQGAQRVMHGDVRVLKNLSGIQILNLYKLGIYEGSSEALSIQRCKAWCYSNIACEYWQYGPGGCWVDAPMFTTNLGQTPSNQVQYPLTLDGGASVDSTAAKTFNWGEYIQHYCPVQPAPAPAPMPIVAKPTEAPQGGFFSSPWAWVLIGLGVLAAGFACIYLVFLKGGNDSKPARSTKNRGMRDDSPSNFDEADLSYEASESRQLVSPPGKGMDDSDFMGGAKGYENEYGPPSRNAQAPVQRGSQQGYQTEPAQPWVPTNAMRNPAEQGPPMQQQRTQGGGYAQTSGYYGGPTQLAGNQGSRPAPQLLTQGGMPYQQQQMYGGLQQPQRLM